jgi:hypothetical protein
LLKALDEISAEDLKKTFEKVFFEEPKSISVQIFANSTEQLELKSEQFSLNHSIANQVFSNLNYFQKRN